jgi:hypothetical protein
MLMEKFNEWEGVHNMTPCKTFGRVIDMPAFYQRVNEYINLRVDNQKIVDKLKEFKFPDESFYKWDIVESGCIPTRF